MAKPGGGPSFQGFSLQGRGRQEDRAPDFPYPLTFIALQFLYSRLNAGAGHGPNESRITVAWYQLRQ